MALMTTDRMPLIAGNWKLNLDHLQSIAFVQKLAWSLKDSRLDFTEVEVAVFPPFTDLRSVQTLISADKLLLKFGAQDVSAHESGAYTGEVAASFLAALDCDYVIVGHSERRQYHHETDELIGRKAASASLNGVVPVICVGETADDLEQHGPAAVPVAQLTEILTHMKSGSDIVVAYEPVWAIGSGTAATPEQAQQVASALRAVVATTFGDESAATTRVLYGGSVKSSNIAGFMAQPDVDGALVGGASLDIAEFSSIARFQKHVGTA